MKKKIPHDPFNKNAPQVSSHVLPPEPPDLPSIDSDESRGGKNATPNVLTDPGFTHGFVREKEHAKEYDFSKGKK